MFFTQDLFSQYIVHEDAFLSDSDLPCNCATLTPDEYYNSGSFWNTTPLDLSNSFEIIIKANFGCITETPDGGDGLAFLLQTNGSGQLPTGNGGNLGYNGITPSLAVQFDTYRDNPIEYPDNNDPGGGFFPYYDHVGLMKNGSCNHQTVDDISTVPFSPTFTDVEDCNLYNDHQISFIWDVLTQNFQVIYCNDLEGCFSVVDQNIDISNDIFNGDNFVYWGFTASTGGAKNEQTICVHYFDQQPLIEDTIVCYQENLQIDLSCMNNFSFEWKDLSGSVISSSPIFDIIPVSNEDYTLTITNDYTGRSFTEYFSVLVLQPELEEVLIEHLDNECYGYSQGQFTLDYINSFGQVNYILNGVLSQSNPTFTNLSAGSYQIIAEDEFNCKDSLEIIIFEEAELVLNIDNIIGVLCNTTSTGVIEVTPFGGVGSYSLNWIDENGFVYNQEDLFAVDDGFYDYTLTDGNNCSTSGQLFVDQINAIDMDTLSLINVDCFEAETGEISVTPTGGLAPFVFEWSGPNNFTSDLSEISNLSSGNYTLTLTDSENCYRIYPFELLDGNEIIINIASISDANCFNSSDGIVEVIHSGGNNTTFPVVLDEDLNIVSNLDNTSTLSSGDYLVYAEDNLGCRSITIPFSIGSPSEILITPLDVDDVTCFLGDDGKVQINLLGGTLPYNGFIWSGPNAYANTSQNIYSLVAGNYTVSAVDANGCIGTETFTINQPNDIIIETANIDYVKCKGDNSGSITPLITGGTPPYGNYNWTGPGNFSANSFSVSNLFVGEYNFTVEDNYECEKEYTFNIFEPDSLLQLSVSSLPSCLINPTGQANINVVGGVEPYTIDWLGADPTELPAGLNFVKIIDNASCIVIDSFFVDLFPQPTADFKIDSILKLNEQYRINNQSSGDISWAWDFGNQTFSNKKNPTLLYNNEGNYTIILEVINEFGCIDTISKDIQVLNDLILYLPNTFTPNGDNKNDTYKVSIINHEIFAMKIYNSYGTNLFSTNDNMKAWDGTYQGKMVQEGVYTLRVFVVDVFGRVYNRTKNIILVR